jgi:mono/diheme cytochrome c family protein
MANGINRDALRLVSTALLAAVLVHRGAEAAELKACVDKSSPAAAMDARLAQAVGRAEGKPVAIVWFDGGSDGDDGLSPRKLLKLAGGCDLMLGFPVDAQSDYVPEGFSITRPYAQTGFALVTRRRGLDSLDRLPAGSNVAVTYMTAPNLYFSDHPRLTAQVFRTDDESLRALKHGQVSAAMLWQPYLAKHLDQGVHSPWHVSALNEPHARWNLVALYRSAAQAAAQQFEQGIEQLQRSGRLEKLVRPYAEPPAAVPAPAPTATAHAPYRSSRISGRWQGRLLSTSGKAHTAAGKAPPALYTEEQAEAGKQVFMDKCAMCHGPTLEGRAGPALKGPAFATPQAHFTVSDVFKIVSQNMPAPAPGTLPPDDYVKIMSFLLEQNGYPAGSTPLDFDAASRSRVKLIYRETRSN